MIRKKKKVFFDYSLRSKSVLTTDAPEVFFSFSQLDNYNIRDNAALKVNISIPNLRLFVGNIPKSKSQEEIVEEFSKRTGKVCYWKMILNLRLLSAGVFYYVCSRAILFFFFLNLPFAGLCSVDYSCILFSPQFCRCSQAFSTARIPF